MNPAVTLFVATSARSSSIYANTVSVSGDNFAGSSEGTAWGHSVKLKVFFF